MILAFDVGNTNILVGCIDSDEIGPVFRLSTNISKTADEYAAGINDILSFNGYSREIISGAVISSVVPPLTGVLKTAVRLLTGIGALVVGAGLKSGINIRIDDPAALGGDMVATAVGALALYSPPIIIVDIGTATKITVVDKSGSFIGGAILPGVSVSMNALSTVAAQLPKVPLEPPHPKARYIHTNTVDCMKSGAIYGTASMIDGMTERFESELGEKATIVATGGLSDAIYQHCNRKIIHNPHLILRGLQVIYDKNKRK